MARLAAAATACCYRHRCQRPAPRCGRRHCRRTPPSSGCRRRRRRRRRRRHRRLRYLKAHAGAAPTECRQSCSASAAVRTAGDNAGHSTGARLHEGPQGCCGAVEAGGLLLARPPVLVPIRRRLRRRLLVPERTCKIAADRWPRQLRRAAPAGPMSGVAIGAAVGGGGRRPARGPAERPPSGSSRVAEYMVRGSRTHLPITTEAGVMIVGHTTVGRPALVGGRRNRRWQGRVHHRR